MMVLLLRALRAVQFSTFKGSRLILRLLTTNYTKVWEERLSILRAFRASMVKRI